MFFTIAHPPFTLGPELPHSHWWKNSLWYFNVSGKEEKESVGLIAFNGKKTLMLNKENNKWENDFINHQKLVFNLLTSLHHGYRCASMVCLLICSCMCIHYYRVFKLLFTRCLLFCMHTIFLIVFTVLN